MHIYGLILGIATIVLIEFVSKKEPYLRYTDYILISLITLFFSRTLYVLHNLQEISLGYINPIAVWDGGLTIYGAIFGLSIGILITSKKYKKNFSSLLNTFLLYLPLSQAIGRWGNFFNNEIYGKPTNFLGIYIPIENRLPGYEQYTHFQPTFIYESALNLFNFIILLIINKHFRRPGFTSCVYFINYGLIRLAINTFRIDKEYIFNIETSDMFSVMCILLGILLIFLNLKHERFNSKDNI